MQVRRGSARDIGQWLHLNKPDLFDRFIEWLGRQRSSVPGRARPDPVDDENTRIESPPVSDQRGGRLSPIDVKAFVRSFWDSVGGVLPENADLDEFSNQLMISLQQIVSDPHTTITVEDFLAAVRKAATHEFSPDTVDELNSAMGGWVSSAVGVVGGEIGNPGSSLPRLDSARPRLDDVLPLDKLLDALSPP